MQIDFVNVSLDLIEGLVAGGLLGFGAYIVVGALASLPGAFLTAAEVTPLSVLVGALGFVGYSIPKVRGRIQ
jgi:hypothetical protein